MMSGSFSNSEKVTVWCALSIECVIRLHYFEEPIFIADNYLHVMNNYFLLMFSDLPQNTVFQQDGAPPYNGRAERELLDEELPKSWI